MTRRSSVAIALGACLVATLFLMPVSAVQDKDAKGSAAKESRIDGTIQSLDKGTKTIVVRLRGKGDTKQVVYARQHQVHLPEQGRNDRRRQRRPAGHLRGHLQRQEQLIATRVDVRDEEM